MTIFYGCAYSIVGIDNNIYILETYSSWYYRCVLYKYTIRIYVKLLQPIWLYIVEYMYKIKKNKPKDNMFKKFKTFHIIL